MSGVLLRAKSHRARSKLNALVGSENVTAHFVFMGHNDYVTIPAEHLEAALTITGVDKCRRPEKLMRCWEW